jgi:hypothetical protein
VLSTQQTVFNTLAKRYILQQPKSGNKISGAGFGLAKVKSPA